MYLFHVSFLGYSCNENESYSNIYSSTHLLPLPKPQTLTLLQKALYHSLRDRRLKISFQFWIHENLVRLQLFRSKCTAFGNRPTVCKTNEKIYIYPDFWKRHRQIDLVLQTIKIFFGQKLSPNTSNHHIRTKSETSHCYFSVLLLSSFSLFLFLLSFSFTCVRGFPAYRRCRAQKACLLDLFFSLNDSENFVRSGAHPIWWAPGHG